MMNNVGVTNIGHIRETTGVIQTLEEHLEGTSEVCERFTRRIGLCGVGRMLGLLHDLGKASADFNEYISEDGSGFSRGDIDHSTAGAQFLYDRRESCSSVYEAVALEMMESAIMSHHSGLMNYISAEGVADFIKRVSKDRSKTYFDEAVERIDGKILDEIQELFDGTLDSFAGILEGMNGSTSCQNLMFRWGLMNRFILSSLIDADRIDTIAFQSGMDYVEPSVDWARIRDRFEERISSYGSTDDISKIRARISDECKAASVRDKGLFTLSVPTGGGKTISSFRFAVNHLCEHDMERIIYVVPYLSILEQNVAVIRKLINEGSEPDLVTECHSNVDIGEDSFEESSTWNSPMDSWDGPVIFTSMVQFLEVLFSSGTKRIRRMHNLANAVIVFDEIQSLPVKTVFMFNEAVNFLCRHCGASVVLCTATQPCLGSVKDHPLDLSHATEIMKDVSGLFRDLKRTRVSYVNPTGPPAGPEDIAELAVGSMESAGSVLIIVNTKRMARDVYGMLKNRCGSDVLLTHLSTNMCSIHRASKLGEIVSSLGKRRVVCVSTQLIEAGVDVDFDVVIRSMAGLDSIAQAAGRCNRNARRDVGDVYVIRTDENLSHLEDIAEGCRCSEVVLRHGIEDVLSPEAMNDYYQYYFYKRISDMAYKSSIPEQSLFAMLSSNKVGEMTCKSRNRGEAAPIAMSKLKQAFKDANTEFKVIDANDSVVVPYDDVARQAIAILCSDEYFDRHKEAMRTLQRYSVNTFDLNGMMKKGMVKEIQFAGGSVHCLVEGYYDDDLGITETPKHETLML